MLARMSNYVVSFRISWAPKKCQQPEGKEALQGGKEKLKLNPAFLCTCPTQV